jgi:hypothetical protein
MIPFYNSKEEWYVQNLSDLFNSGYYFN